MSGTHAMVMGVGGGGGGGGGLALDSYTSGLWGAYGLTQLLTAYAGSAIRVRRSSDNTEQDIGFSGSALDTTALASFVGANSAFVVTWYDQSGGSNNLTQATAGRQPRIVNAGSYEAALRFNLSTVDQSLRAVNDGGTSGASKSIFRRVLCRVRASYAFPYEYGDGSLIATGSADGELQFVDGSSAVGVYMAGSGAGYALTRFTSDTDPASLGAMGHIYTRGLSPGYSGLKLYTGGALRSQSSPSDVPTTATGNFTARRWRIGARSDDNGAQIDMTSCAIYDADKSSDALAINAALT